MLLITLIILSYNSKNLAQNQESIYLEATNQMSFDDAPIYLNQFAVYIPKGEKLASEIAEKHGFKNLGKVIVSNKLDG